MAQVELRAITKAYPGGPRALAEISLSATDGAYLTIVGPSGSGKSTLLRVVAGVEEATAGEVWIGGRRANDVPPHQRDVAMVFQDQAPYPHLNVAENLAFSLRARRLPPSEVRERVAEVAALLGLSDLLRRAPRSLSGGERRRVTLGRALARRPALLLLDEPLSGLDAPLRAALRADLIDLHQRLGTTTLHVTHDQGEALALGDRVAVLDRGRLMQLGAPIDVYERPASRFVAGFIGNPPMSLLPSKVEVEDQTVRIRLIGVEPTLAWSAPAGRSWAEPLRRRGPGPIDLGLRPDQVLIGRSEDAVGPVVVGIVRRLEPLGHETLATLALGRLLLMVRLPRRDRSRVGDQLRVQLDLEGASWFEPGSGLRLG